MVSHDQRCISYGEQEIAGRHPIPQWLERRDDNQGDSIEGMILFSGYPMVICDRATVWKMTHLECIFPWKMVMFHSYVKLPEGMSGKNVYPKWYCVVSHQVPGFNGHKLGIQPFFHGFNSCVLQASPIVERGSKVSTHLQTSPMLPAMYSILYHSWSFQIMNNYRCIQYCTMTILKKLMFTIHSQPQNLSPSAGPWDRSPSPHRVPRWVSALPAAAFGQCGWAGHRCCRFGSVSHQRTSRCQNRAQSPWENDPVDDHTDDLTMKNRDFLYLC